jgi:hypothetical protein
MMTIERGSRFDVPIADFVSPHRPRARARSYTSAVVAGEPNLPTYATVADVLEKKNGSGWRLAGWTLARILMIAPPMMFVGVPVKLAFQGAALSSGLISIFTMIRISNAAAAQGVGSR